MKAKVRVTIDYAYENAKCKAVLRAYLPVEELSYYLIPQLRGGSLWGKDLGIAPGVLYGKQRILETAVTADDWGTLRKLVNKSIGELKQTLNANAKEYNTCVAGMPQSGEITITIAL